MSNAKLPKLYVCISLDVEEEGLFSGNYASRNLGVSNVALLPQLKDLSMNLKFPLTLFCAHSVFKEKEARNTVIWMQNNCGAEIGAHLHHWSTPPFLEHLRHNVSRETFADEVAGQPVRTDKLPQDELRQKLETLLDAATLASGKPITSFRMGRWDLKSVLLPMLTENGIKVDSSICPLRAFKNGPDHFLAPADPYWVNLCNGLKILEAPVTQLPLAPVLAKLWHKLCRSNPELLDSFHFFGALSANPFWHGAGIMRAAARIHAYRGGKVLSLFWHSSEMLPGGSPHVPDKKAARARLKKIYDFCHWLRNNFNAQGVTASQLAAIAPKLHFAEYMLDTGRDW